MDEFNEYLGKLINLNFVDRALKQINRLEPARRQKDYFYYFAKYEIGHKRCNNAEKLAEKQFQTQQNASFYEELILIFIEKKEPIRAQTYAKFLPEGEEKNSLRNDIFENFARTLMEKEPKKSLGFALMMQQGNARDSLLVEIVYESFEKDPETARKAVEEISDPTRKAAQQNYLSKMT